MSLSPDQLHRAQGLALEAARRGPRGANPLVGAVLLDAHGQVLHIGHHRGAGTAHAEADVLAQARAAGTDLSATALCVTLEPCSHTGRTGPCAQAVIDAGIPVLHYGQQDPTAAAGGGAEMLRAAGVEVHAGLRVQECRALNHRWTLARSTGRPFLTAKTATTLDGLVAAADGTSQWITGRQARQHGHRLRRRADAVLVGTGTALADDPALTARDASGQAAGPQPLRAVMGHRELPASARLHEAPGFLALHTHDPHEALGILAEHGAEHVLLEGGAGLLAAFLAAGLVDELCWYQAPLLLGQGRRAVQDLGIQTLQQGAAWRIDDAGEVPDGTEGAGGSGGPQSGEAPGAAGLSPAPGLVRLGKDLLVRLVPAGDPAA